MKDETPKPPADGPKGAPPLGQIKQRMIESAVMIEDTDAEIITYQHTVFCQTGLPYRAPGAGVRTWEREQGKIALRVEAGEARHPDTGEWIKLGLPYGTKPRLILAHLNREALIHKSPEIEVGESLTAFVKRIRRFDPGGREIRAFKTQLGALAASLVRLAAVDGARAFQIDTKVVTKFDLWLPKDERQRVLWPSTVCLSLDYYESLKRHAVPLDERAIAALAHNAMALDVYAWLAQRLRRVEARRPVLVPWSRLREQFGPGYARMDKFKAVFRRTLNDVLSQYRGARVKLDERGMWLRHSPPPIKGRYAFSDIPKD